MSFKFDSIVISKCCRAVVGVILTQCQRLRERERGGGGGRDRGFDWYTRSGSQTNFQIIVSKKEQIVFSITDSLLENKVRKTS